ncbi:MAG: DedA family protein [Chitinophagales bacterium]|nr:DedA family protein [Chitinophagales bacterium]
MGDNKGFIQQFIEWIIQYGGLYVLLLVVFAETGLFVGFFLPGDSLLFAAGIYAEDLAKEFFGVHWIIIMFMVALASVLGNIVGYWFGYKAGPLLYERKESWLFKKKHLLRAKSFYDKYGKLTIFFAKFLPFIRTFAPIVAGMVKMNQASFLFYNIIGSVCWVSSMMLGGHFLQQWVMKEFNYSLKDHIEAITIIIVLITTLPVLYKVFFRRKESIEETPPPSKL